MRNLKKFLALVLAMMMAFSLMVTANASTTGTQYNDVNSVTPEFGEAVDVLTGMGVYSGDNGDFKPAANITRAEVAALIYRLATGDVNDDQAYLYARYGNFPDVREDAWYAGYVGYCANAGYIKGRADGTFDPTGDVTGYEALAMILRAIGYDKNGEFTGATWQTEVSALSQQLGILDNVKTTQYGGTLYLAARRDVVADLLFRADAYVNMVNYTPAFGYQPYGDVNGSSSNLTGGKPNNSLGYKIFGLTEKPNGIVIGNQETGETATIMGYKGETDEDVDGVKIQPYPFSAYTYAGEYIVTTKTPAGAADQNRTVALGDNLRVNLDTGIDLIGHQVRLWIDANSGSTKTVYAYFDEATLAEVVKVEEGTDPDVTKMNGNPAANSRTTNLYNAMSAAGFTVGSTTDAYWNNSFGTFSLSRMDSVDGGTWPNIMYYTPDAVHRATATSPAYLYMVVSNSANKAPDAVIALNIQASQVTGVDNINTITTVTVPFTKVNHTPAANDSGVTKGNTGTETDILDNISSGWPFIDADNVLTPTAQQFGTNTDAQSGTLEQGQLVGNSAKTRDQNEIGLAITGTQPYAAKRSLTAANNSGDAAVDNRWFKLNPVTETKDGVVIAYTDDTVTLQDGTVLERSIVYDTVVSGSIPQVKTVGNNYNEAYEYTNYRFYITKDNKYIGAERMYGSTFLYGTYVDYSQELNSSAFKYYMTGVTLDGETTTMPVSSYYDNTNRAAITGTNLLGVPYRDTVNATTGNMNGIGNGKYTGFAMSSEYADWRFSALDEIGVISGENQTTITNYNSGTPTIPGAASAVSTEPFVEFDGNATVAGKNSIIVGATEVNLGAAYAGTIDIDGNAGGSLAADALYFTENTKFILVSGFGTDSLNADVYDGITALRGDSTEVQINMHYTVDNITNRPTIGGQATGYVRMSSIAEGARMADMSYLTQSPFLYAQNQVLSRQADVIILPAVAVTRTENTTLRYVGNAAPTLVNSNNIIGQEATQFTMYNNGEAEQIWVQGLVDGTADNNKSTLLSGNDMGRNSADALADYGHDHFYRLSNTGLKANDGQPIYTVRLVNEAWAQNTYLPSTYSAQTGTFTSTLSTDHDGSTNPIVMANVANAKITNLNSNKWPGIVDLTTLNEAGSLGLYPAGIGNGQYGGVQKVYVSVVRNGDGDFTQIYVCYNQPNT